MKKFALTYLTLALLVLTIACKHSSVSDSAAQNGVWVPRANFPGVAVGAAATFTVNNEAYVGTGINPSMPTQKLTAMYKYTPETIKNTAQDYDSTYGSWTLVAPFPGQGRSNAVGFNIGATGYLGSGLADDGFTALADFYSYNPVNNTWTAIDSIHTGGSSFPRYDAVAFSFDTTAYVLTGYADSTYLGDVWQYSPSANVWTSLGSYPGSPRAGAVTFVYKGQGYLVTGFSSGEIWSKGNLCYDFWRFTPGADNSANAWVRLNDIYPTGSGSFDAGYTDIIRSHANSFLILGQSSGDKGYITLGSNDGTAITSTWEYDFASDRWTSKAAYTGTARSSAVSFTLTGSVPTPPGTASTRGFIATGLNTGGSSAFGDCEEFFPNLSLAK
jgi:N-acetylneuraminic acid mutarotase